jgi:hypothetical protein
VIATHDDRADERHRMSRRTVHRILHITSYPGWLYIHLPLPRWGVPKKNCALRASTFSYAFGEGFFLLT